MIRLFPITSAALLLAGACGLDAGDTGCGSESACTSGTDASGGVDVPTTGPKLDLPEVGGPETCADVELIATQAGCRFWAVDLPNAWEPSEPFGLDIADQQQFAVVVTNATTAATATVKVYRGRDGDPVATATIDPDAVHTFELPALGFEPTMNGGGKAYRIESDFPITAYQFQPLSNNVPVYSNDASALFPEHVLGTDYIAVTGDATWLNMYPDGWDPVVYNAGAFVTMIGVEANTTIKIYPAAGLAEPLLNSLVMGRGDAFTVFSDLNHIVGNATGDLSGTRIIADRPIAVFSGSVTAVVPAATDACCADHLEHQMMPLWAWGNAYVVAPPPSAADPAKAAPALYRLTGAFDDTALEWPGGAPAGAPDAIHANQTVVFQTSKPFAVRSTDGRSFALTQFLLSSEAADPGGSGLGDPAMTVVPAAAQMQPDYAFLVPDGYEDNYVTIVAPASATVKLDGDDLDLSRPAGSLGGVDYVYRTTALEPGPHHINASEPVGITVIGYDDWVSYAYTGGSGLLAISDLPPTP